MQTNNIPISLHQFNKVLEDCKSEDKLRLHFPSSAFGNFEYSLSGFVNAVYPLIGSYTDLSLDHWRDSIKIISHTIPRTSDQDQDAFTLVQKKVDLIFCNRLRLLEGLIPVCDLSTSRLIRQDKLNAEQNFLRFEKNLLLSSETRIDQILTAEKALSLHDKASVYQNIINLLIMEAELISLLHTRYIVIQSLLKNFSESQPDRMVMTQGNGFGLVQFPTNIKDSSSYSFFLNFSRFFTLSEEDGSIFISWKMMIMNKKFFRDNFLDNPEITDPTIKKLIAYSFRCNEEVMIFKDLEAIAKLLCKYILDMKYIKQAIKLKTPFTPFLDWILPIEITREALPKDEANQLLFMEYKPKLQFWIDNREKQRALYTTCLQRLDQIIQGNSKNKIFFKYKKDQTDPSNFEKSPLRSFPTDSQIFGDLSPFFPENSLVTPIIPKEKKKRVKAVQPPAEAPKPKKPAPIQPKPEPTVPILETNPFPYILDERVDRWRNHPFGTPLSPLIFPEYEGKSLEYQILMHLLHDLSLVDPFVLSMGIQGQWMNASPEKDDIRYVLPAEITFKGITQRGVITYAIDRKTNVLFHQFFTKKLETEVVLDVIRKTFNENDFPDLKTAVLSKTTLIKRVEGNSKTLITTDPIMGNVTIEDFTRGASIKLFKVIDK